LPALYPSPQLITCKGEGKKSHFLTNFFKKIFCYLKNRPCRTIWSNMHYFLNIFNFRFFSPVARGISWDFSSTRKVIICWFTIILYVKFSAQNYKFMGVQALRTDVPKEKVRILILYKYLLYNNRMVIQIVSEL
jgi:hypothetical protein